MKPKSVRQRALISPIELAVFMGSIALFAFSAYRFFMDSTQLDRIATLGLETEISSPLSAKGTTRKPASFSEHFSEIKLDCNDLEHPVQTGASKVRLVLNVCPKDLKTLKIENIQNRAPATVFHEGASISTDYFSLEKGENTLRIQAKTASQQTWTREVKIIRN